MRNKNLEQIAYWHLKKLGEANKQVNLVNFAKMCQKILEEERMAIATQICDIFGYDLVARKDVTDYSYRKYKKYRINVNGRTYLPTLQAKNERSELERTK